MSSRSTTRNITINILVLISLFSGLFFPGHESLNTCGVTETLQELAHYVTAIKEFLATIHSFLSVIGLNTLVLLLMILFFSAGLTALGVPRGKISFVLSLGIADMLWILWEKNFNPLTLDFFLQVLKANAIISHPVIAVFIIKTFFPKISKKIKNLKSRISPSSYRDYVIQVEQLTSEFHHFLIRDLLNDNNCHLSKETRKAGESLKETLKKMSTE